jgi:hypothetical protein
VVVTILSLWLGVTANRANRQRRAVETIRKAGGQVLYDYECDDDGRQIFDGPSPPGPNCLRNLIGIDYFATVAQVGIDGERLTVDDSFAAIEELPQLRLLVLNRTGITDSGLARFRGLTELRVLEVWGSSVTDDGWEPLKHFPHLKTLWLSGPNITDSTLLQIKDLTNITDLVLLNAQVTDSGLKCLKTLHHLKHLDIDETKISAAGVGDLKRVLPELKVNDR